VGQAAPCTPASSSASRAAHACGAEPAVAAFPLGITQRPVPRDVTSRMRTGASMAVPSERYGKAAIWRMVEAPDAPMPDFVECYNDVTKM